MGPLGECEQVQMRGRAFGESAMFLVQIGLADRSRHAHTIEEKPAVGYCGTRVGRSQARSHIPYRTSRQCSFQHRKRRNDETAQLPNGAGSSGAKMPDVANARRRECQRALNARRRGMPNGAKCQEGAKGGGSLFTRRLAFAPFGPAPFAVDVRLDMCSSEYELDHGAMVVLLSVRYVGANRSAPIEARDSLPLRT